MYFFKANRLKATVGLKITIFNTTAYSLCVSNKYKFQNEKKAEKLIVQPL